MNRQSLSRRDFLKIAGATAVTLPIVTGYALFRSSIGEIPPVGSPYDLAFADNTTGVSQTDGSPILLLTSEHTTNPFGGYLGEILRAEGINCFHSDKLSSLTSDRLSQHDIVLLAEGSTSNSQTELLENYVFRGGCLVAMRPDPRLSRLLGLEALFGESTEGYIQVEDNHPVAEGISTESLQYHGAAYRYRLAGAGVVAWLSDSSDKQNRYPAITIHRFGDGQAAMWAFDLARSVAYMRQGNPAWANQERDGFNGIRTVDVFKDWIDLDRMAIPQADEQQRLLVNLLSAMSSGAKPLPRLWYFPGQAKGMLVATGDSHMNPAPYIEEVLGLIEQRDGHMSVYYSPQLANDWERTERRARFLATDYLPVVGDMLAERFTSPTPAMVKNWRMRGHEFALHPYVEEGVEQGWQRYWQEFTGRGYGPVPPTVRTHRILWTGWAETARIQSSYGIRMNLDYYHVGPSLQKETGEWVFGHLTGSGQPMRFVDEQGRILNIFQQNTQLADEHLMAMDVPGWGGWPNLSPEEAVEVSKLLLDRSVVNGGYSAIAGQFHVDPFQVGGEAAAKARHWLEGTLDHAVQLGLPIYSAQEWLRFVELRYNAMFGNIEWFPSEQRMIFQLKAQMAEDIKLDVLIPLSHDGYRLARVEVDKTMIPFGERKVGGVMYASTSVSAAAHEFSAIYN